MSEEKDLTILEKNQDWLCKRIAKGNEKILFFQQVREAVNAQKRVGKTNMGFWEKIAQAVGSNARAYKTSYNYWPVELTRQIEPALFNSVTENSAQFEVHKDFYNVKFADIADELIAKIDSKIESEEAEQKVLTFRLYHLKEFFDRYNAIVDELSELYKWFQNDGKGYGPTIVSKWGGEERLVSLEHKLI